ncbi:bacteriophage abortive infection AbiH family protein [Streptococcus oralis]|uniref:AbiH family protein n=1 Tax=Streptococcus oralis TaxID=1303 RepID=UPI001F607353|nr:AbiH family protein [Streptococcus oralis]UNV67161.1 bacteriophage abortive infection AbiH family protein [Streptococcus oralis]
MADTILILGNGFDIAMGRKTKYEEFLEFTNDLNSRKKYIVNFRRFIKQYKKIKLSNYKDNLYLKFINENKDTLGENWSNLEIMISRLADGMMYFKENSKVFFECYGLADKPEFDNHLLDISNYNAKHYIVKIAEEKNDTLAFDNNEKELLIEALNNIFIKELDLLIELLEIYLSYLDYLDFEVRKIEVRPTALDAISDLSNSSVLNFNYTNTSSHLFGTFEEKTHFIHGRIDLDRQPNRINTMVFGIEDKENDVNSDLIPYQKYYQRVVKETGNKFEEFFIKRNYTVKNTSVLGRAVPTRVPVSKNIVIFGHSVDPLDKEIFQKCFELAKKGEYPYRFIFTYYDDVAKRSIIKNLAIILGKEKLVELTGKRNVVFVKSDDKIGMEKVLLP